MRLLITVLVLIVLPTALLSVLAGRSLQARELILQRRLEQDASVRLDEVAAQMERRLAEAQAAVALQFRETVLSDRGPARLDRDALKAALPTDTVLQSFLFMNPWAFIYPDPAALPPPSAVGAETALQIQPVLVRKLSEAAGRHRGRVMFALDNRLFCFGALADYVDLYAGMELNLPGLMRHLQRLLSSQTDPYLRFSILSAERPGRGVAARADEVLIHDSFGMQAESASSVAGGLRREGVLAARRLAAPLAHIEIGAKVVDAADLRQTYRLQERLTAWGILLLAVVISGSALILIAGAVRQINTARRRSEFMAGMSHDLRTPVAAMRVLAESLQAGRVTVETRRQEFLEAIITECDRLGDLIERVMFYFRQEQGALRYEMTPLEMDVLVAGVADRFRRQHAGRVHIQVTAADRVPPVKADVNALEKVLNNLIDNAVKYGGAVTGADALAGVLEGGVTIEISTVVRRWRWRTWVVVTVRDRGNGLVAGEQRRIFGRFYRGRTAAHAHRGGFGLGLSLVADIISAHHGRIRAYNAPAGGAVFEIWLHVKGATR